MRPVRQQANTGESSKTMTAVTTAPAPTTVDGINIDELSSAAVREEYWERGYWISPKLFSDKKIAELRQAQERMWRGQHDSEIQPQYGATKMEPGSPAVRQQCDAFWLSRAIGAVTASPPGRNRRASDGRGRRAPVA